jgi:tetratricopeptide (TPR) repeat protein/tRNA A-37 threonylcarbamoyl transferase component Bud32
MALVAGSRFDRYEVIGPIGAGGMGEVYLAHDPKLGRKVALKLLPERYSHDDERVRRFEQEARAASALSHPYILAVHDVGEVEGVLFSAAEYVEGRTLREVLKEGRPKLAAALDVAIQTASALSAAHEAGIVHRDIKPENIMVRRDGYVKVLDFGLAKLTESDPLPADDPTALVRFSTEPGIVLGTPHYMSPEQARALRADARTDIFSLGVVLYEMVVGHPPFQGQTTADVIAAILDREPMPLAQLVPQAPAELDRIVTKALEKDREERYQVVKDLLLDLKKLRQHLDVEAELQRLTPPQTRSATMFPPPMDARTFVPGPTDVGFPGPTRVAATTGDLSRPFAASGGLRVVFAVLAAVLVAAAAGFLYLRRPEAPILTDKDTILLADVVNTTGDEVFDGTIKQGLAVQLQQSPFLSLFPDNRVRQTLRLMGKSPDERVTPDIARQICQRQGLKALIAGSIAPLGSHYVIALDAVNAVTGEVLAREQVEAERKEGVLKALSKGAANLRQQLGESLSSIQAFDAPLEVTTSSLEALNAFSLGYEQTTRGNWLEAIPFVRRAVEIDPNFAYGYVLLAVAYGNTSQPALAAEQMQKAFALKDRVSALEKLRISFLYHSFVTGDMEKGIEVLELHRRTYPRDARAPGNLADTYARVGQFEKAAAAARDGITLNPNAASSHVNLTWAFVGLGRFAEAKQVAEDARSQKIDTIDLRGFLYTIAFVNGDEAAMAEHLEWAKGRPDEYVALEWQAATAAFGGQWRRSEELSRRAVELAAREAPEIAAQYAAEAALRAAALGRRAQAKALAARALELQRTQVSLPRAALALALGGDHDSARTIAEELARDRPNDTVINGIWLPAIRGALELGRGDPARAIESLAPAGRYEAAAELWPQFLRGEAHLRAKAPREAEAEFQKVRDHRGQAPLSVVYPLAVRGLGRSAALAGDDRTSRTAYQDFLALWKAADSDLPGLAAARREYAALAPPAP